MKYTNMRYNLAFINDLLIACTSARGGVLGDAQRYLDEERPHKSDGAPYTLDDVNFIEGVRLTNDEPPDDADVVYSGTEYGWLTDTFGNHYDYAVRLENRS